MSVDLCFEIRYTIVWDLANAGRIRSAFSDITAFISWGWILDT